MPKIILKNPAIPDTVTLRFLKPLPMENGRPNINVIADMDIIVPTPNNSKYAKPDHNELIVGSNTNITTALPANPWIVPMIKDLSLK